MASPEPVIRNGKLETKFLGDRVQHTKFHPDASQGGLLVKVVKTWRKNGGLGSGEIGAVYRELSEEGEYRAVKAIPKYQYHESKIDYLRELMAVKIVEEVRNMNESRNPGYPPSLANCIAARYFVRPIAWVVRVRSLLLHHYGIPKPRQPPYLHGGSEAGE